MPTLKLRLNTTQLEATIGARLSDPVRPVGPKLVAALHRDVDRQFLAERYRQGSATTPWIKSRRVRLGLGGSPRTLDDTGAYRAAWTGKGAGSRTSIRERGIGVGVDPVRFPHVRVFQGQVRTHVAERPIGISQRALAESADIMVAYVTSGEAA